MNAPTLPRRATAPIGPRAEAPRQARPALSLHIDRIVLDGFTFGARDRERLQSALQAELSRLLGAPHDGVAWRAGGALAALRGGELRLAARDAARDDAPHLGRAIARSLHAEITS